MGAARNRHHPGGGGPLPEDQSRLRGIADTPPGEHIGASVKVCEVERDNDFNYGLDKTKAIYLPHLMAYPQRYLVDPEYRDGAIATATGRFTAHERWFWFHGTGDYADDCMDEFEIVGRNPLDEPIGASAAVAGGRIYIRGQKHLFAIGDAPAS